MISEADIHNAKILVVDDHEADLLLMVRVLEGAGYTHVTSESNAYAVCPLHQQNNYDLILLDLELPGMDGFDIIQSLKEIDVGIHLSVLVLTAHSEHKLRALKVGVKDFVNKPLEINEVLARVQNMVEMRLLYMESQNYTKKLERALRELGNSHNQIQVLNTTLVNQNTELQSYSHFVSHDLRAPLRFVNHLAHMTLKDPDESLPEKATKHVNMIMQATDEMEELIERLLNFSQANLEPVKKRRVDLRRVFLEVATVFEYQMEGRNVEIVVEDIPYCVGDRTLLKEVATNLVGNAFKFAQRSEGAKITIGCTKKDGEDIYFVKDNGAGFDMMESDFLFLPFKRLHKEEDFKGTGIGLSLVKRIIERHGGRIWAEGEIDKGATFFFTLGKATAE